MAIAYFQEGVAAGIPYGGTLEPYLYFCPDGIFLKKAFLLYRNAYGTRFVKGLYIYFLIEIASLITGDDIALKGFIFPISGKGVAYLGL